jgi:hypothetical protein
MLDGEVNGLISLPQHALQSFLRRPRQHGAVVPGSGQAAGKKLNKNLALHKSFADNSVVEVAPASRTPVRVHGFDSQ